MEHGPEGAEVDAAGGCPPAGQPRAHVPQDALDGGVPVEPLALPCLDLTDFDPATLDPFQL